MSIMMSASVNSVPVRVRAAGWSSSPTRTKREQHDLGWQGDLARRGDEPEKETTAEQYHRRSDVVAPAPEAADQYRQTQGHDEFETVQGTSFPM
jgi:hypothetical protein